MTGPEEPKTHGRYALVPTHDRPSQLAELVAVVVREVDLILVIDNASSPPVSIRALREAAEYPRGQIWVIRDEEQPPNLARMWNAGFDAIHSGHVMRSNFDTWDVAVLNDDALPSAGWLTTVADAMREHDASPAAACMLPIGQPVLKTESDRDLGRRMYGPAFVVRGELTVAPSGDCPACAGAGIANEPAHEVATHTESGDAGGEPAVGCSECHGTGSTGRPPLLRADERLRWWWQDTDLDWQARALGGVLIVPGPYVPNRHANESTVGELGEQAGRDGTAFVEKWGFRPW